VVAGTLYLGNWIQIMRFPSIRGPAIKEAIMNFPKERGAILGGGCQCDEDVVGRKPCVLAHGSRRTVKAPPPDPDQLII